MYVCTYDTFMGDQWRAVATVRRSEGENVIPISKMQVHLSTSYVETQDIHTKASASRVNLLGTRLFLLHTCDTHTNVRDARRGLLHPIRNYLPFMIFQ